MDPAAVPAPAHPCGGEGLPVQLQDMDSEGLLLLTDDGALTQRLLHPSHQVEKEYLVWVAGNVQKAPHFSYKNLINPGAVRPAPAAPGW